MLRSLQRMWLLFAFLAALAAAFMSIVAKFGLRQIDPTFATGIRSAFMFLFMAIVVVASGKLKGFATLDHKALWAIILSAIFGALSWLFYFFALRDASASKVAAIDRLSLVFVIFFSVLFFSETLSWKLVTGGILATVGIFLISIA